MFNIKLNINSLITLLPKIISFFRDLIYICFKQRKFVNIISRESNNSTISRCLLYYIFFFVISRIIIGSIFNINVINLNYLGSLLLTFISELYFLLIFYLVSLISSQKVKFKIIFCFYVLLVSFLKFFPFLFYALFLSTENYIYLFLRGVLYYFIIIFIFAIIPVIFNEKIFKRIISLLLCFLLLISFFVIRKNFFPERLSNSNSLLSDPIFEEVFTVVTAIDQIEKSLYYKNKYLYKGFPENPIPYINKYKVFPENPIPSLSYNDWKAIKDQLKEELINYENSLFNLYENTYFNTTKMFIQLKLNVVQDLNRIYKFYEDFFENIIDNNPYPEIMSNDDVLDDIDQHLPIIGENYGSLMSNDVEYHLQYNSYFELNLFLKKIYFLK